MNEPFKIITDYNMGEISITQNTVENVRTIWGTFPQASSLTLVIINDYKS